MASIDDQELLELINATQTKGSPKKSLKRQVDIEIDRFINVSQIIPGDFHVPVSVLYAEFLEFTKLAVTSNIFTNKLRKYLRIKSRTRIYYVSISSATTLNIDPSYSFFSDPTIRLKVDAFKETKHIGVYMLPNGTYIAKLVLPSGKYLPGGRYKNQEHAALAYDSLALQVYGADAVLNFRETWKGLINGKEAFKFKSKEDCEIAEKLIKKAIKRAYKKQKQDSQSKQDEGGESKNPSS